MKRFVFALILLASTAQAVVATAAPLVIDVDTSQPNQYMVHVVVDRDGQVTARYIPVALTLRIGGGPVPDDPGTPQPELGKIAKAFCERAASVSGDPNRATTALELATLYREVAKKVRAGEIKTPETILKVIRGAADLLLGQKKVAQQWQPTRDLLSTYWTKLSQESSNDADFAKLLEETAIGLEASTPNLRGEARQINVERILEIIRIIMELLKLFQEPSGAAATK